MFSQLGRVKCVFEFWKSSPLTNVIGNANTGARDSHKKLWGRRASPAHWMWNLERIGEDSEEEGHLISLCFDL